MSDFLTGRFVLGRRDGRTVHARFIFILLSFVSMCLFDDSTRVFSSLGLGREKEKSLRKRLTSLLPSRRIAALSSDRTGLAGSRMAH